VNDSRHVNIESVFEWFTVIQRFQTLQYVTYLINTLSHIIVTCIV
jgi:hypothetical protein